MSTVSVDGEHARAAMAPATDDGICTLSNMIQATRPRRRGYGSHRDQGDYLRTVCYGEWESPRTVRAGASCCQLGGDQKPQAGPKVLRMLAVVRAGVRGELGFSQRLRGYTRRRRCSVTVEWRTIACLDLCGQGQLETNTHERRRPFFAHLSTY